MGAAARVFCRFQALRRRLAICGPTQGNSGPREAQASAFPRRRSDGHWRKMSGWQTRLPWGGGDPAKKPDVVTESEQQRKLDECGLLSSPEDDYQGLEDRARAGFGAIVDPAPGLPAGGWPAPFGDPHGDGGPKVSRQMQPAMSGAHDTYAAPPWRQAESFGVVPSAPWGGAARSRNPFAHPEPASSSFAPCASADYSNARPETAPSPCAHTPGYVAVASRHLAPARAAQQPATTPSTVVMRPDATNGAADLTGDVSPPLRHGNACAGTRTLDGLWSRPSDAAEPHAAVKRPRTQTPPRAEQRSSSRHAAFAAKLCGAADAADAPEGQRWEWLGSERRDAAGRRPDEPGFDPTTLTVPREALARMTKFARQYWRLKSKMMHVVLLVRVGAFYELYDTDADLGLEIGLTMCGKETANMYKVGFHEGQLDVYVARLLSRGRIVGRVEEMPGTKNQEGLVSRKLVQVYTPASTQPQSDPFSPARRASASADTCVDAASSECVLALVEARPGLLGVCVVDTSLCVAEVGRFVDGFLRVHLDALLAQYSPREIVTVRGNLSGGTAGSQKTASAHMLLGGTVPSVLGLVPAPGDPPGGGHGSLLSLVSRGASPAARRLVRRWMLRPSADVGEIESRLRCVDAMLANADAVSAFQGALRELPDVQPLLVRVVAALRFAAELGGGGQGDAGGSPGRFADLLGLVESDAEAGELASDVDPRAAASGAAMTDAKLREVVNLISSMLALADATGRFAYILAAPAGSQASTPPAGTPAQIAAALQNARAAVGPLKDLGARLSIESFTDGTEAVRPREGLSAAFDAALAEQEACEVAVLEAQRGVKAAIAARTDPQAHARLLRGVVGRSHDWTVECSRKLAPFVPPELTVVREAHAKIWVTSAALRSAGARVDEARDRSDAALASVVTDLADVFLSKWTLWQTLLDDCATLDALAGFADVAARPPRGLPFCRPTVLPSGDTPLFEARGLWNPVLTLARPHAAAQRDGAASRALGGGIVANDVALGGECAAMMLLTGANSGGKTTLMRATCVACVLAQIGCWAPATALRLTCVDQVFVRIGAEDRIVDGHSTFYVEALEAAACLNNATRNSLVALDELGRGTSTHDGYAVAFAALHYLATRTGCRGLFATHYHALAAEAALAGRVQVAHMASDADEEGVFRPLFKLSQGPAPAGSCGIRVAEMLGLPRSVAARAAEVSRGLEEGCVTGLRAGPTARGVSAGECGVAGQVVRALVGLLEAERTVGLSRVGDVWEVEQMTEAEREAVWRSTAEVAAAWQAAQATGAA
ncbi:unnamed protein product [Pedinophyceae sp. YPF-701]|nr:unnamed protein product [Pedinophyceae sp. YPF-701]